MADQPIPSQGWVWFGGRAWRGSWWNGGRRFHTTGVITLGNIQFKHPTQLFVHVFRRVQIFIRFLVSKFIERGLPKCTPNPSLLFTTLSPRSSAPSKVTPSLLLNCAPTPCKIYQHKLWCSLRYGQVGQFHFSRRALLLPSSWYLNSSSIHFNTHLYVICTNEGVVCTPT